MSSGPSYPDPSIGSETAHTDIWVVEDDLAYQQRVVGIIARLPLFKCTLATSKCEAVLESIQQGKKPQVILMDIALEGELNGIDGTWEIKELLPEVHILALTSSDQEETISSMIMAGASGYLLKPSSPGEIQTSIYQVLRGGSPLTPKIAATVMKLYRENATPNNLSTRTYQLSKREIEILSYLTKGKTKKEVARLTTISKHTVDSHIRSIYKKLQVHNRSDAIMKAIREGIVTIN